MPDFKVIEKLGISELEKLLGWGIQRQLRWAVFTVTHLIALLTIFIQLNGNVDLSRNVPILDGSIFYMLVSILALVLLGLFFCIGQVTEYYIYVGKIEKILLTKYERKDAFAFMPIAIKRKDFFIVNKFLEDRFTIKSKTPLRIFSIVLPIGIFILSKLIHVIFT